MDLSIINLKESVQELRSHNLLSYMEFGSHLYGTSSPTSDRDYKGVFLPSTSSCLLCNSPRHFNHKTKEGEGKNSSDDVDIELFSLQNFFTMAKAGEMIVIDMLHATDPNLLYATPLWKYIYQNRSKFYSKNMSGYIGYIRKQTAKYCVKGSRLDTLEKVINYLKPYVSDVVRVSAVWDGLPKLDHTSFENIVDSPYRYYQVCGKLIQETVTINYAIGILQSTYDRYGARAIQAKNNEGIDWKAVSHAFRAGYQLKELYTTGDLKFPLAFCEYLRDVKLGKLHYVNDRIGESLDSMVTEVEALAAASTYPATVDSDWMDQTVKRAYSEYDDKFYI